MIAADDNGRCAPDPSTYPLDAHPPLLSRAASSPDESPSEANVSRRDASGDAVLHAPVAAASTSMIMRTTDVLPPLTTHKTVQRNKYRDEMEKELERLRKAVPELEAQLLALRQGKSILSSNARAKLDLAWQRIAKSQLTYRRQSEAENRSLKSELRRAIHMTQLIDQMLASKRAHSTDLGRKVARKRRVLANVEYPDGFAELIVDVDASFARLDDMFQVSGIDQVVSDFVTTSA